MKSASITSIGSLGPFLFIGCILAGWNLRAATITGWDFDDGTLQGWTNVSTSTATTGPTHFVAMLESQGVSGGAWDPLGYHATQNPNAYMVGVTPFNTPSGIRDGAQNAPLVLRSPTFELHSGQIMAHLLGGPTGTTTATTPPTNYSAISGASTTAATKYLGIALRRDSDGAYLLHRSRTGSGSTSSWQQVTFSEADLMPIIAGNPAGTLYTLDLIDTAHGSFGTATLDTATIPSAPSTSVVAGGGQWSILERRQSAALTNLGAADALLGLPTGDPGILSELQGSADFIDYLGSGSPANGIFGDDNAFLGGSGDRIAMLVTGLIEVVQPGPITFGFFANDGARLRINGNLVAEDNVSDFGSEMLGTINLPAGLHTVEFTYFENGSGENVELFVATTNGTFTSMNQASFELLPAAVPEPASCLLVLCGMAALLACRKRYRVLGH